MIVLERNAGIARETSSRNSQVIHAGLYYPRGSLKAQLCVAGAARCTRAVRVRASRIARSESSSWRRSRASSRALDALRAQGEANGAPGLALVDGR